MGDHSRRHAVRIPVRCRASSRAALQLPSPDGREGTFDLRTIRRRCRPVKSWRIFENTWRVFEYPPMLLFPAKFGRSKSMANSVAHFEIFASDVERARKFYERVFGWRFEIAGPPDFYLIFTGAETDPGITHGLSPSAAVQPRKVHSTVFAARSA